MSITAPPGFVASAVHGGVKPSGETDMALVATEGGEAVVAAGVYTESRFPAPPVQVCRRHLAQSGGRAAAVLLNSGNANAGTGAAGRDDAEHLCAATASLLGCEPHHVLPCSTGLIGNPLPVAAMASNLGALAGSLVREGEAAARAIMTTDTVLKQTVVVGNGFTVGGMAKGAAMLAPNMGTMLAVLTTDAAIEPAEAGHLLRAAVADSFNRLSVDGCQSTNDTVILLANGRAGAVSASAVGSALESACGHLAAQMAGDAEGATKVVRVVLTGAASDAEADRGARQIADSNLCKCSWYGSDPYWGRLAAELGVAGITLDADRLSIRYGDVEVCRGGVNHPHDAEALGTYMRGRDLEITCDLGLGDGSGWVLTNDLTHGYIDENMGTS